MPRPSPPATLSHEEAVIAGHKRYLGKPCNRCGTSDRLVSCRACYACHQRARKDWQVSNRERHKQMQKDWYDRNHKQILDEAKDKPQPDPVERHRRKMRYKAKDTERYTRRKAEARARRSDLAVFDHGLRRERKHIARKNAKNPISPEEKRLLAEHRKHGCAYCGSTDNLHLDHVIPISRDGTHELRNVQWLCGPHNTQKLALTHDEYVIWCIERDVPLPLIYCGWNPDIEIFGAVSPAEIEISESVSLWETILHLAA